MTANGWPGLITLLVLLAHTAFADYQSGLDAYNSGDYNTALNEWKAAAEPPPDTVPPARLAETHYAIGMLYWQGLGVQVDYFEAAAWMRKAAELGHAGAAGKLGYLYTQGITVPQNYAIAFEWFSKAATQGDIDGQYNLGVSYLNGWGVEPDKTLAAQYLAAAAARGDMDAEAALAGLLPQLNPSMREAIANGNDTAIAPEPAQAAPQPAQTAQTAPQPAQPAPPNADTAPPTGSIILPTSWILEQNPAHYTIQVIGLRSMQALENLVSGHENMAPFAVYVLQRNNLPLHLLVQGVYPDVASARAARDKFPRAIQKPADVWIRKFEKVQALIQAP